MKKEVKMVLAGLGAATGLVLFAADTTVSIADCNRAEELCLRGANAGYDDCIKAGADAADCSLQKAQDKLVCTEVAIACRRGCDN